MIIKYDYAKESSMASHPQETERFKSYIASQGLRWTDQRQGLLDAFLEHSGHQSAESLHQGTKAGQRTGFATVYRTLKHLVACGLAREVDLGYGKLFFEKTAPNEHHDHLVCVGCGLVVEFLNPKIEHLQEKVAETYGFNITHHRLMLYGVCSKCHEGKRPVLAGSPHVRVVPKSSVRRLPHETR
jgi:Fur family ferric uptake transcriptional regulator